MYTAADAPILGQHSTYYAQSMKQQANRHVHQVKVKVDMAAAVCICLLHMEARILLFIRTDLNVSVPLELKFDLQFKQWRLCHHGTAIATMRMPNGCCV